MLSFSCSSRNFCGSCQAKRAALFAEKLVENFIENWAFQCGYCTAGMLISSYALLMDNPNPNPEEIRAAIAGNLCRCTGYHEIIEAVSKTAIDLQQPVITSES